MEPATWIFLWKNLTYVPDVQKQCHLVASPKTTRAKYIYIYLSKYLLLLAAQQAT